MRNANRLHALCSCAALAVALVAGCSGSNGAPGQAGTNGTSCSVTDDRRRGGHSAARMGRSVTVPSGTNGMNGMNGNGSAADGGACTVTKNGDAGTYTLDCGGDAGAITVLPAVADYATMSADEKAQAAMTAVDHQRQLPRRRAPGHLAQGHRAPRLRREGPHDRPRSPGASRCSSWSRGLPAPPAA